MEIELDFLDVKKEFDNSIKAIWNDDKYISEPLVTELIRRRYWIEEKLAKNAVLFIGINPSYGGEVGFDGNYYLLTQKNNHAPRYNTKFELVSENINHHWTHHDLFFFRQTEQKIIQSQLWKTELGREFLDRQAQLSFEIIETAKPKIIVVTNALVRKYFAKFFPYLKFSEEIGTHIIDKPNSSLNNVPVFFTSMLSGQRALDLGSLERLEWHIRQILKN